MIVKRISSLFRIQALGLALCSFLAFAYAGDPAEIAASFPECQEGEEIVMVFGTVGERFEYKVEPADDVSCAIGLGASGERCALPEGIRMDRKRGMLVGVPAKGGFHEFVVLLTDKGVTTEKVLLIDIEERGLNPMKDSYASSFRGAAR